VNSFLYGTLSMGAAVIALLFARSWRLTGERLLAYFAAAFAVLAANWVVIAIATPTDETRYFLYLPRLFAFCLIIAGIVDKNRRHSDGGRRGRWSGSRPQGFGHG
jgi:peptidoglycan/LPS O-acetylase OafA/YrhL